VCGANAVAGYLSILKVTVAGGTTSNAPLKKQWRRDGITPTHIDAHGNEIFGDFGSQELTPPRDYTDLPTVDSYMDSKLLVLNSIGKFSPTLQ